jgi:beta-ureidopropionase / N-carbamoyl-L-amino-acid hydrolase
MTLDEFNRAPVAQKALLLDGLYEHSPWVAERALAGRTAPFASLAALKYSLAQVLDEASLDEQVELIRAHPELAQKARVMTAESTGEQRTAGLTDCTADEFSTLHQLNRDYNAKFGWPFIVAVRGPRGLGLSRAHIIATFTRRLQGTAEFEQAECVRQINRIAEIRLDDKFNVQPVLGNELWDWHERLSEFSDQAGQLTVTYLTDAHRACAVRLSADMRECGFDEVSIDAVGNVVGRYHGAAGATTAKYLLTGSHFDTVRNGGKYDGRLGIYTPMMCVRELHRRGQRLKFGLELVAFSEEEGQRFKATFLSASALVGNFNHAWLEQLDAQGVSLRAVMQNAGLNPDNIAALKRDPSAYLGFVEVHVEQGPVLNELNLPLGVVTSINGSVRYVGEVLGVACHAGTTPMDRRRDAAAAVAELVLYVEQRAARDDGSVGTVGILSVPNGSINVVPGRCQFTLDLRAPNDPQRDALVRDVLAKLGTICKQRGVQYTLEETLRAAAAPSDAGLQARWERAVESVGAPIYRMPSGAGHDAMKLHEIMPQAMLFVRGENSGISHNPLESTTAHDMQLAIDAFTNLLTDWER